jgi:ubiquinone/menaquinone biosynthesis C-methylase UbiE
MDEWKAVVRAVERALPLYESISEIISMGLAGPLRRRAIRQLERYRTEWILDSGTGPGTSSRMMLEDGFKKIAGLDPSPFLLQHAKATLGHGFYPVIGVAENLPFRNNTFYGILNCFSLRDVRNTASSLAEFARTTNRKGRLEIVDVGKPDGLFRRKFIELYVAFIMPIIARFFVSGRTRGNPFRMIVPTFHQLARNRDVTRLAEREFGSARLHEFLLGGLVIIEADQTG